jgi:hypothetical protein
MPNRTLSNFFGIAVDPLHEEYLRQIWICGGDLENAYKRASAGGIITDIKQAHQQIIAKAGEEGLLKNGRLSLESFVKEKREAPRQLTDKKARKRKSQQKASKNSTTATPPSEVESISGLEDEFWVDRENGSENIETPAQLWRKDETRQRTRTASIEIGSARVKSSPSWTSEPARHPLTDTELTALLTPFFRPPSAAYKDGTTAMLLKDVQQEMLRFFDLSPLPVNEASELILTGDIAEHLAQHEGEYLEPLRALLFTAEELNVSPAIIAKATGKKPVKTFYMARAETVAEHLIETKGNLKKAVKAAGMKYGAFIRSLRTETAPALYKPLIHLTVSVPPEASADRFKSVVYRLMERPFSKRQVLLETIDFRAGHFYSSEDVALHNSLTEATVVPAASFRRLRYAVQHLNP